MPARARDTEPYETAADQLFGHPAARSHSSPASHLAAGEVKYGGTDRDLLLALLRELKIPVESQVVVFSKTSLQRQRIRPIIRARFTSRTIVTSAGCRAGCWR